MLSQRIKFLSRKDLRNIHNLLKFQLAFKIGIKMCTESGFYVNIYSFLKTTLFFYSHLKINACGKKSLMIE